MVGYSRRPGLLVRGGALNRLFNADHTSGDMYETSQLTQLIAVLGPPPTAFLALSPEKVG